MLATDLAKQLASFSLLSNKNALSQIYSSLYLTPTLVRGCSAFGVMEVEVPTGIERPVVIDAEAFLQVLKSLPGKELSFSIQDSVLQWECDFAKGKLALKESSIEIPELQWPINPDVEVTSKFSKGLELGALACGSPALLSLGLYGILIHNFDQLRAYSTDDTTISSCLLGEAIPSKIEIVTLSPDAVKLLVDVTSDKACLAFDESTVYCSTPSTRLLLKQIAPLKHDIKEGAKQFSNCSQIVILNRDVISRFVRRSEALTENKGKVEVSVSVNKGSVRLEFDEGKSFNEEYYLAEGSTDLTVQPVTLEARRMTKVLSSATSIAFDHAKDGILIFQGDNEFQFVICGKTGQQ